MNNLAAFSFYFPNQVSSFVARVAADPVISTNIRMNVIASDCVPVPVYLLLPRGKVTDYSVLCRIPKATTTMIGKLSIPEHSRVCKFINFF